MKKILIWALGKNEGVLYEHFVNWGMAEGRVASPYFDINVYKEYNPDLVEQFGSDNTCYYQHYIEQGKSERRIASMTERNIFVVAIENVLSGNTHAHLWYVYAIIGLYMLTPLLKVFVQQADRKTLRYALIFLFVYTNLLPMMCELDWGWVRLLQINIDKMKLGTFAVYAEFFLLGHYLDSYEQTKAVRYGVYSMGVIGTIISIVSTLYLCISGGTIDERLLGYMTPNVLFQSIAIFLLARQCCGSEGRLCKLVMKLSSASFGIYGIHVLVLLLLGEFGLDTMSFSSLFSVPVLAVVVLAISYCVTVLLQKIPVLNRVVS